MTTRPSIDRLVDALVDKVNGSERPSLPASDAPEAVRDGDPDAAGRVAWRVRLAPGGCPWIGALEARLPGRLPPSFRSLVSRYLFPAFELGPVELFANTGAGVSQELADTLFADRHLAQPLLREGFVQVGRPTGGSYDPVAFDLGRRRGGGECPLVRLDHELALTRDQAVVIEELAPSFLVLMESWQSTRWPAGSSK